MNNKILNTLISTPEVYRRIISKIISNKYISEDISLINSLENYIIENKEQIKEQDLKNYINFLYDLFRQNKNIIFKFKIFNYNDFFEPSKQNIINDTRIKLGNKIYSLSHKLINNEKITNDDKYLIFDFMNSNINNTKYKNFNDNILKYLLNNYKEEYNYYIINYITYIITTKLNTNYVNIYYSNNDINDIITINNNNNIKYVNNITNLIYNIITKIKETIPNNTFDNIKNIIFKKYLTKKEYEEYILKYKNNNYDYYNEINTWQLVIYILKKYSYNNYLELINLKNDTLTKYYYRTLYITKSTIEHKEKYNVDKLDKIVKNNIELITEYPLLNNLYNSNGTKLNIITILENESKLKEKYLFNDYVTEFIQTGKLLLLDINKLTIEQQFLLLDKILILLKIELEELKNNIKLYKILDKDDIRFKERTMLYNEYNFNRVNKIKYYINYINDNNSIINRLIKIDNKNNNTRKFNKDIKDASKYLKEIIKNINDSLSEDIKSLREVTIYGE